MHPTYVPFERARNQQALKQLVQPTHSGAVDEACLGYLRDFSPSLFAEIDWQCFRPDLHDPGLRQILGFIDDYLFIGTLVPNILTRDPSGLASAWPGADLERFEALFARWREGWLGPDRNDLLAECGALIESIRRPHWDIEEQRIVADVEAAFAHSPPGQFPVALETALLNARFRFLDLPWTRRRARSAMQAQIDAIGDASIVPSDVRRADGTAVAEALSRHAQIARDCGHDRWASLLADCSDRLRAPPGNSATPKHGEWSLSLSPCARCSMWFALRYLQSIDTSSADVNWSNRGIVYIPPDIGVAGCPFCGLVAPVDVPMMFYAPQRHQVVYLIPTKGQLSEDDAIAFWRVPIEAIRNRYRAGIDTSARAEFDQAGELVTHSIRDFLYAVQAGDTIPEDHVYNLIALADGSGLVWDGTKLFARVITPVELEWYRAHGNVEEYKAATPAAARQTIASTLPSVDSVDTLLHLLADTNDEIGKILAEATRHGT
jgi:hypothetical protein